MNNSPIGVFDSGVGGLTVAREIMRELPDESIVYFGDTARVPYGSKSRETVTTFSKQIIRFLKTKDVKAIVIACNTASAFALHEVAKDADIPIIGVIEPGARTANNVTENVQTSKNEENSVNEGSSTAVEVANKLEDIEVDTVEKYKTKEDVKLKVIPLINALELEEVKKDTEVEVKDTINNWICVTVQGKQGWVIADKLEKLEKVETKTQESTSKNQETSTEQNVEQENSNQNVQQQEQSNVQETQQVQNTQTETVKQTSKTMYINTETVNLRSSSDRTSTIVVQLAINTKVEVVSEENGWSKVSVNGKEGYILSSLLSATKQETSRGATESRIATANKAATTTTNTNTQTQSAQTTKANTSTNTSTQTATSTGTGASVVAYAKQFIGTKYTYGGSSPSTGFDCSGFTSYVYKHFGISLPRTSGGQSGVGTAVSKANLQAGDLVIYRGHVAIYVGGGNVIHSPRPGKTVCIVPLGQAAGGFSGGRRIIK